MDLSIIMPFAGEYPQVLFTIQATAKALEHSGIKFEIIAVDNWCDYLETQQVNAFDGKIRNAYRRLCQTLGCDPFVSKKYNNATTLRDLVRDVLPDLFPYYEPGINRSGGAIEAAARGNEWLKYVKYENALSHWQAKREGVKHASADTYLFMDAHCIPDGSLASMYYTYVGQDLEDGAELRPQIDYQSGTMHIPLTYKILEWRKEIYKIKVENEGFYSYQFTRFKPAPVPFEVPVMSTCGMMISKQVYDKVGGWPATLGIYGGGENFMNYTCGVLGIKKWIYPHATLHHHGEKRDYHYTGDNIIYNRALAHYLFGGKSGLQKYLKAIKGKEDVLQAIGRDAMADGEKQREHIRAQQVKTVEEFVEEWTTRFAENQN